MKTIKVGLIGTGYIGVVHLEMLRRLGGVEVVAVADPNRDLARRTAERFGVPKVYADAASLIEDREIEVVHDCAPNNAHFDINARAIRAGKEVLSEKPLALDSGESGELVDLAEKHGTLTAIDFCYRYYPVVQEAAARAKRGDLGVVRAFVGHFLQDWLLFETDYSWRLDPAVAGRANVAADLGSHWCDLVQFVTGQKIVEVMAELHTCVPKRLKPTGGVLSFGAGRAGETEEVDITLDDYAALFLKLENGARGNFTTCQAAAGRKVDLELQIFGSKESYAWSHVHPNALWIGHREKANEVFYESSSPSGGRDAAICGAAHGPPHGLPRCGFQPLPRFLRGGRGETRGQALPGDLPRFPDRPRDDAHRRRGRRVGQVGRWVKVG